VYVCVSVCPQGYLRKHTLIFNDLLFAVARFSSCVVEICTYGFVDDTFFYNERYSGMNFATKDRFRLNLLIYLKSDRIQFPIIKEHNFG